MNALAFVMGLLFGPVGLWMKHRWAAGFAWLVVTLILGLTTGGIAVPFCWIGMAVHAALAEDRPTRRLDEPKPTTIVDAVGQFKHDKRVLIQVIADAFGVPKVAAWLSRKLEKQA